MKKTTKKLSLGMKIASVLACLAIVSVGFASWWIVNYPKPVEHTDGSFVVYGVETKDIYFEDISWGQTAETDAMIIFGHPEVEKATKGWFGYNKYDAENNPDGVKQEDLSAVLDFTLTIDGESGDAIKDYINYVYIDFTPNAANFGTLMTTKQYIAAPTLSYSLNGEDWSEPVAYASGTMKFEIPTTNMTTSSQAIKVKFTFDWGEYFNDTQTGKNLNPFDFYFGKSYDDYKEQAAEVMKAIKDDLTAQTYSVKIYSAPEGTATAPANN